MIFESMRMMIKQKNAILLLLLSFLAIIKIVSPIPVKASDGELETQAEFQVNGSLLSLGQVPTFQFGEVQLTNGMPEKKQVAQKASKNNQVQVTNYDDTVSQWVVSAEASQFKDEYGNQLTGAQLILSPDKPTNDLGNTDMAATSGENIIDNSIEVLTSSALGTTSAAFNGAKNATLDLSRVAQEAFNSAVTYTATIDWTLSDQPKAPSASSYS